MSLHRAGIAKHRGSLPEPHAVTPSLQDLKVGAMLRRTALAQGLPLPCQDGTSGCLLLRPFALIKTQGSAEPLARGGLFSLVSMASCRS